MRWELWEEKYREIVRRLGLSVEADERSAMILNSLLPEPDIEGLARLIRGRVCVVVGAGPSVEADLEALREAGLMGATLIAADGATSVVLRHRTPEIIVTDLDGNVDDQVRAWREGSWVAVHGHGDNVKAVRDFMGRVERERVIGTTQTKPFGRLFNFGGFTDGDRAAFMAHELGARLICLAGMDLGEEVGVYSGSGKNAARKAEKLRICGELLSWLAELGAPLVNLTSGGEMIPNIPHLKARELGKASLDDL